MIVRDEEADLPRCLASLAGVADELVVVDTGSRDRTMELAVAAGAKLVRAGWQGDFAGARNASLDAATGDWCLVLDADEELPAGTRAGLRAEIARAEAAGLRGASLVLRNLSPPGQLTAWDDAAIVRLFRRAPDVRYAGRIHEQIAPAILRAGGRIGASELVIVHHGYARATVQGGDARARRNLELLEQARRDSPDDAYVLYQLGATQMAAGDAGAAASLERALAVDATAAVDARALSNDAEATARLKLAQLALARAADAIAIDEAGRCLALQPANAAALQIVIVASVTLGRLADAAVACRALLTCTNLAGTSRADLVQLARELGVS